MAEPYKMIGEVTVRDARTADLEGLIAIGYADRPAIHRDRLRDAAVHNLRFLVAERMGTIVGFCLLVFTRPPTWPEGAPTHHLPLIIDLYVAEALRGQGIGTLMIRHMEKLAFNAGYDRLFLGVDPIDNPRAYDLYVRLGYEPLQAEPHRAHWRFMDSDGNMHEGEVWSVDMVRALR